MAKHKVLILGGGMGGLSTAYWLSHSQDLRDRYEVTLVSQGWRLGGKLASGREPSPPFTSHEHGLHVWFGFYDNAFALLRHVWDRWHKPTSCPIRTWEGVVVPQSFTPVGGKVYGQEATLDIEWPTNPAVPGEGGLWPNPWQYVVEGLRLFEIAVEALVKRGGGNLEAAPVTAAQETALSDLGVPLAARGVRELLRAAVVTAEKLLDDSLERDIRREIAKIVDLVLAFVQAAISPFVRPLTQNDVDENDLWCVLSVGTAFFRGICNPDDGIVDDGNLDRIDHLEYRAWLKENGADADVVDHWRGVRSLYDCCFQYTDGDPTKPNFAAGTAARVMLRIVTQYKGACLYLFNAGVGEAVIAPLYEVCIDQGVTFKLFTEVKHLHLDAAKQKVSRVTLHEQVTVLSPPYQPLFDANGFRCWRTEPDWSQLQDGAILQADGVDFESPWGPKPAGVDVDVVAGVDYDTVVLAVALGAFKVLNATDPSICQELIDDDPGWKRMCESTGLSPSLGYQLWMKPKLKDLGWTKGPPAMVGFTYPNAVWADMTPVIESEMWPDATAPKSLHYFCGNIGSTLYQSPRSTSKATPLAAAALGLAETTAQMKASAKSIWPQAVLPSGDIDPALIAKSYLRVNMTPTELCEGTPADCTQYKMAADTSGYQNLVLAGAWIRTGINASCVEAAVMSGMQASRAISRQPEHVVGEDFLHIFPGGRPSQRRLPRYLSRLGHGEQSVEPPGLIKGAKTYCWMVPANNTAMQQTVDNFLNVAGQGEVGYTVLGNAALLSFLDGAALTSTAEIMGNVTDREVAFWIPLLQKRRHDPIPTLCLWMPYVVVDKSIACVTGRESWGFLKEVGSLAFPVDSPAQKTLDANAMTFTNFGANEMGEMRKLVSVRLPGGTAGEASSSTIAGIADLIAALVSFGFNILHATQLLTVGVPLVNVKQFRDARRPKRACYQALIGNQCKVESLNGGDILKPGHKLDILPCASHQIVQDLGLPGFTDIPLDVGFLIKMDFSVDAGDEIHRA